MVRDATDDTWRGGRNAELPRVREPNQERQPRLHFLPLAGDADAADSSRLYTPRVMIGSGTLLLRPTPGPPRQREAILGMGRSEAVRQHLSRLIGGENIASA